MQLGNRLFEVCDIYLPRTQEPTARPSLRAALQLSAVQEVTLRAVIKHLGLSDAVHKMDLLEATQESEEYKYLHEVTREVFRRLDGLVRQLLAMAEAEQKWAHEVEDVQQGLLQPSAAFFNDYHLQEVWSN